MNTAILPTNFDSFIFQSGDDLKTTSLKVAEAFGKDHSNVLKAIDKVLTQVSEKFKEVNFNFSEYTQTNALGKAINYRLCELTKDGFIMVVMSFTGAKAFAIKEAYISAFNLMHAKFFPKRNGLVEIASPYISEKEARLLQKAIISVAAGSQSKTLYTKLYDGYGITTYHHVPAGKVNEALVFLGLQPPEMPLYQLVDTRYLTDLEQKAKALPAPTLTPSPEGFAFIPLNLLKKYEKLQEKLNSIGFVLER